MSKSVLMPTIADLRCNATGREPGSPRHARQHSAWALPSRAVSGLVRCEQENEVGTIRDSRAMSTRKVVCEGNDIKGVEDLAELECAQSSLSGLANCVATNVI